MSRCWVCESKDLSWISGAHCPRRPLGCLPMWGPFPQPRPFHFSANISICFHQQLSEMPADFFAFLAVRRKISLSTGSFPADQLSNALHRPAVLFGKPAFPASCRPCVFLAAGTHCWPTLTPTPLLHSQPASPQPFAVWQRGIFALLSVLITAHSSSLFLFIPSLCPFHRGLKFSESDESSPLTSKRKWRKCYLIPLQEWILGQHPSKMYYICPV